ncbi:MAG: hypothetical protein LBT31_08525 [Synergistaceae bacterium]|jgi:hypothetical protein|nr:hypothetical protein [Synergistaceae bacterium]
MSVVVVSMVAVTGYTLLQSLAMAAGAFLSTGAVIAAAKSQSDRMDRETMSKKNLLISIALEKNRIAEIENDLVTELRDKLDGLAVSLDKRVKSDAGIAAAIDELGELQRRIRGAEMDGALCDMRARRVLELMESLRSSGMEAYEKELDRLAGELEKIGALPPDEKLLELQGVFDELLDMEKFKGLAAIAVASEIEERRYVYEPQDGDDWRRRVLREIRDWAGRVAEIDETEGKKLDPMLEKLSADTQFPDRLTLLRKQVKTTWATLRERAAASEFFRETLASMINVVKISPNAAASEEGALLVRRCDVMLNSGKFIDRPEFMVLYEDIARFVCARDKEIADSFLTNRLKLTLGEMGYELLTDELPEGEEKETARSAEHGAILRLDTPYEGYQLMLRTDSESVAARLVRVTDDTDEKRDAEGRLRDVEVGKKWCHDFDNFLVKMKDQGLPIDVSLRQAPGEAEVIAVESSGTRRGKRRRALRKDALRDEGKMSLRENGDES